MRIETQYGDARFAHREILDQRLPELAQLGHDPLFGNRCADLRNRDMNGYQPHLQQIAAHQHQRIAAEFVREKFGMPGKAELFALHVLLADRSRNHRVDQAGFQVGGRSPERSDGSLAGRRAQHARFDAQVAGHAIDQADPFRSGLAGRHNRTESEVFRRVDLFFIKRSRLGRTVNDRRAQFAHSRIAKRLDNHLVSDAVHIALRNTDPYFGITHTSFI